MTTHVTYIDVPAEVEQAISPHVEKWLPVLPRWVNAVAIIFVPGDDDSASLSCLVRPEYRSMTVQVHPGWLSQTDERKRSGDVLHEFLHAPLETARDVFLNTTNATIDDTSPLYSFVREEYRKGVECAVNDLEDIIMRLTNQ